ncbi:DEAD/DEAH box helicase family protein [uncultured Alistipes sp.]|uniref:type III restriction-modification system endonuclease n=1 Tax=uncultured Alistipes sp. TaxID=538949 RepID=UPI00259A93B7|nr:DEAD/DEAH box helicase family protein [uncultured Alistipes sp.]
MKLKFKNQDFQTDAVNAVADLFAGQEKLRSSFTIQADALQQSFENEYGFGNKLLIEPKALLANMHAVQKRHNLPQTGFDLQDAEGQTALFTEKDTVQAPQFSIEMETGTGKTYVYTKTIFELNKRYGFTKFIIVVPSVAIREGVHKSLQVTGEHFANHYDNVPCRYFIYNSARLSDVRQFATSANIEIMIINIDAFKKAENVINQAHEKLNGETAMKYICATNPVVIIDEPQSVDNTPKAKEAVAALNPLCVLRYSATHREKINLLYRLTPVDAYQMGLVKQICVSSNQAVNDFNKPYIRLESVSNDKGFSAKVEMDVQDKAGKVVRKSVTIKPDSDLFLLSGERELYEGYTVSCINCGQGEESLEFSNTEFVRLGQAIGGVDESVIKRAQIRRTIEAHFSKELRYFDKGIKVLSLFFIDEVKKYRTEEGDKGIYAQMFEECYNELLALPKFAPLKEKFATEVTAAHDGYFSQDKKGNYKNTKGDTAADDDTYNLIMKDKERLLSFESPLRFIFSHSALKEGWDNPNVFQVCTLIEQKSTFTARQKVGRGLRLCVDQNGNRIEDRNINILHVMANESFAEFAETLQREIEQETGVKFGHMDIDLFSGMVYKEKREVEKTVTAEQATAVVEALRTRGVLSSDGRVAEPEKVVALELPLELEPVKAEIVKLIEQARPVAVDTVSGISYTQTVTEEKTVSYEEAKELIHFFEKKGYVSKSGKIKDTMKEALLAGKLDLPEKFESARKRFETIIGKANRKPPIRDASRDVMVRINKQVILSPQFTELWDKIKQKTTYRVKVDTEKLIRDAIKGIVQMEPIPKARIVSQTADIQIDRTGVRHTERDYRTMELKNHYSTLPNIVGILSEQCLVTRQSVHKILIESERLKDFLNNPQLFIEKVAEIINDCRHQLAIEGIRYIKLDDEEYSVMEIFNQEELLANLDKNAVQVEHSVYDYVVYDSETIERPFAVALDKDPNVKLFFKIPSRFKIDTPIGSYNPDWAVYFDEDGVKKLYFVLETKGTEIASNRRNSENLKIYCGRQHFRALGNGVIYDVTKDWDKFKLGI